MRRFSAVLVVAAPLIAACGTTDHRETRAASPAARPADGPSWQQAANAELRHRLSPRFPGLAAVTIAPELDMHEARIADVAVDREERFVVTGSHDKTVRVWAAGTGQLMTVLPIPGSGNAGQVFAVAISPNGREVAVGGWEGAVYIFRTSDWHLERRAASGMPTIDALRYSRDGKRLAIGLWAHGVRVLETESYKQVFRDDTFTQSCYGLDFDDAGDLAIASWDRSIRIYSPQHALIAQRTFPARPHHLAFDPRGESLLVGFLDAATARVLSLPQLNTVRELSLPPSSDPTDTLGAVAWSADGSEILAAGRGHDHPIARWSREGARLEDWHLQSDTPERLMALKGGALLVASQDPLVGVLNADGSTRWSHRSPVADFRGQARTFRVSADASVVELSWDAGSSTRIAFDIRSLTRVGGEAAPNLRSAVMSHPGFAVADWENHTGPSLDGRALPVTDFETCRSLAIDVKHEDFLLGCEWDLYSFDRSGTLRWRRGLLSSARALGLSDTGKISVVAMNDGTLRWIDVQTGLERLALLFLNKGDDWVMWTPEGLFAGTPAGESVLRVKVDGKDGSTTLVPALEFADLLRSPGIGASAVYGTTYAETGSLDPARYCAEAASWDTGKCAYQMNDGRCMARIPAVVSELVPRYPPRELKEGHEANVTLKVYISESGEVRRALVLESGGPEFDTAAVGAMYKFRFTPACASNGRPVPVNIIYKMKFEMPR